MAGLSGDVSAFTLAGFLNLGATIAVLPVIGRVRVVPPVGGGSGLRRSGRPVLPSADFSHSPEETASLLLNDG